MRFNVRALALPCITFMFFACSRPQTGPVTVSMTFPQSSQFRASHKMDADGGGTIDYSLLCFVVNVTGGPITSTQNSCDVNKGLMAGSVAPGGSLSLDVPNGSGLTFEVYGLLRTNASQACPTGISSQWNWPLNQVFFLGKTSGVSIQPPSATVDVSITLPSPSQNVVVQDSLPSTCLPAPVASGNGRLQPSVGLSQGASLSLYSSVGDVSSLKTLRGAQLSIHGWRANVK